AAELILNRSASPFYRASSRDDVPNYMAIYQPLFSNMRESVTQSVTDYFASTHAFPKDAATFTELFDSKGKLANVVDPWGQKYKFKLVKAAVNLARWNGKEFNNYSWTTNSRYLSARTIIATSAGPDNKFGTADDITQSVLSYPTNPIDNKSVAA